MWKMRTISSNYHWFPIPNSEILASDGGILKMMVTKTVRFIIQVIIVIFNANLPAFSLAG